MYTYPKLCIRLGPAGGTTSPIKLTVDPDAAGVRSSTLYVLDPEPGADGITPARREAILAAAKAASARYNYRMRVEFSRDDVVYV